MMEKKSNNSMPDMSAGGMSAGGGMPMPMQSPMQTPMQQPMQMQMPFQTPMQQPMPMQSPIPSPMANGGTTSGSSMKDFFRGINWVDVGILMLGTAALYYTIYYYRIKIKAQKRELADIGNKMEMMEAKVSAIQKNQQEQAKNSANNKRAVTL